MRIAGLPVALAIALSGCAIVGDDGSEARPQIDVADLGLADGSEFPVGLQWRTMYSWASPSDYFKARYDLRQAATAACMSGRGLEYVVGTYVDGAILDAADSPLNRAMAEEFGYHVPDIARKAEPEFSDAQLEALEGNGTTAGCGQLGWEYAYGSPAVENHQAAFDALIRSVESGMERFETTQQYASLIGAWSQCMSDRGYSYETRLDAAGAFDERPRIEQDELDVRLADLDCDLGVGLTRAMSEFQRGQAEQLVDQNAAAVDELDGLYQEAFDEVLQRIADLPSKSFGN